jgi:hypothetical protein
VRARLERQGGPERRWAGDQARRLAVAVTLLVVAAIVAVILVLAPR